MSNDSNGIFGRQYEIANCDSTHRHIGIVAVGFGIGEEIESRFVESLTLSSPESSCVALVVDSSMLAREEFSRGQFLNAGIMALRHRCEVIVCTDIDMLVPPGLIDVSYELATSKQGHIWVPCRNVDLNDPLGADDNSGRYDWNSWINLPLRIWGKGSWNAMTFDLWSRVGGWNESMKVWGAEDDDLHGRCQRAGIKATQYNRLALAHVNHPPRWSKPIKAASRQRNIKLLRQRDETDYLKKNGGLSHVLNGNVPTDNSVS